MSLFRSINRRYSELVAGQSGQAVLEYCISAILLSTLAFGVVDFARAIYAQQTITSLAAQGANLAMRGTALNTSASTIAGQSANLNLGSNGCVIVSAVFNNNNPNAVTITSQSQSCSSGYTSKIGSQGGIATIPSGAVPPNQQTLYVSEVFYKFQPITPIGKLIQTVLPTKLYDVAYY